MEKAKKQSNTEKTKDPSVLEISATKENEAKVLAEVITSPEARAAISIQRIDKVSNVTCILDTLKEQTKAINDNNTNRAESFLISQAHVLDSIFSSLVKRSFNNIEAGFIETGEKYLKLALKAQSQTIRTIEAIGELKNPKNIAYVAQANISGGHQQVNNGSRMETLTGGQNKLSAEGVDNELLQDTRTQGLKVGAN